MTRYVSDADHAHLIPAESGSLAEQLEQARDAAVGLEGELHAMEIERDAEIARANRAERVVANVFALCRNTDGDMLNSEEFGGFVGCVLQALDEAGIDLGSPRPEATS